MQHVLDRFFSLEVDLVSMGRIYFLSH